MRRNRDERMRLVSLSPGEKITGYILADESAFRINALSF